jgi:general secretion pathway protein B
MSLILDALNRADQERSEEHSRPNIHAAAVVASPGNSPLRRWILEGLIIALAIGAFVVSQWGGDGSVLPAVKKQSSENVAKTIAVTAPSVTAVSTHEQKGPHEIIATTSTTALTPNENSKAKNSAIASLYKKLPIASVKTIKTKPVVTAAVQKPDNGYSILQQIPLLTLLSSRFQRSVPTIDYSIHVYAEDSGKGFVNLNGAIRRIGSEAAPGLRIVAILKDSVVLEYKDTQFRLLALNSWMNFN